MKIQKTILILLLVTSILLVSCESKATSSKGDDKTIPPPSTGYENPKGLLEDPKYCEQEIDCRIVEDCCGDRSVNKYYINDQPWKYRCDLIDCYEGRFESNKVSCVSNRCEFI